MRIDIQIERERERSTRIRLFIDFSLNISSRSENETTTTSDLQSTRSSKRLRLDFEDQTSNSSELLDGINIVDDQSSQPKFLKLINNSSRDISMSGWILKRKIASQTFEHKFPRTMTLKSGATTTVFIF